jgi:hypothetical protein
MQAWAISVALFLGIAVAVPFLTPNLYLAAIPVVALVAHHLVLVAAAPRFAGFLKRSGWAEHLTSAPLDPLDFPEAFVRYAFLMMTFGACTVGPAAVALAGRLIAEGTPSYDFYWPVHGVVLPLLLLLPLALAWGMVWLAYWCTIAGGVLGILPAILVVVDLVLCAAAPDFCESPVVFAIAMQVIISVNAWVFGFMLVRYCRQYYVDDLRVRLFG